MKVLFAVGGEQLSKNIADKYYEKFGEVLEYKNVFYFKALIDEVKKNKTYDRIVINEEFEQYRTNDIEQLDAQLFKNIDRITDEIQDADIILICANRRTKEDPFLGRLYGFGIYNLLIGDDRNINPLCDIIKKPKTKKEARQYLNIDTSVIGDNSMAREDEVDEFQIRSILNYFEGIKNQPEKYIETIDRVAEQYSRSQLKVILSVLPRAVKDEIQKVDRYRYLMMGDENQSEQQVQQPQAQTNNNAKPKKSGGGLFGAFKKHKVNEAQSVGTIEIGKVVQPGGDVDLSSNLEEQKRIEEEKRADAAAKAKEAAKQAELAAKAKAEAAAREQAELAAKAKAEAEAREQAELAAKAKAEVEARKQAELEAKAKAEAAAREQAELAAKAKAEAEAREQAELAAKAKAEAEAREQAELAAKAKAEAAAREQVELAAKAKAEAEAREQAELAAKAKAEAEARKQAELAAKAKAEAEARARAEAEAKKQSNINQKNITVDVSKDNGVLMEIKPNPNAPDRNKLQSSNNTNIPKVEGPKIEVQPPKVEVPKIEVQPPKVEPPKIEIQPPKVDIPKVEIQPKVESPKVEPQKVEVKSMETQNNDLSEQQRRLKEEQEKIAMEQRKIKEEQEKIEEAKRKLREEQEELAKQAQMRNASDYNNAPRYTNNTGATQIVPNDFKKMIVFVGANKSGTTFVTNAIAHASAGKKIKTSILDMTRDKSMFYLYNQNDNGMRKKAAECMQRVSDGEDWYLDTNSNYLKVYTTIPGSLSDVRRTFKHKMIIETVKANCNLTIVDADFTTPIDYFEQAVEIYIVQDLDLLKMPDTTLFLRELKNRGMDMKKVKIIINKYVKTSLTPKQIIQALSYYSDPNMSFVDELLPGKPEFSLIPYNLNNYAKYIDCVRNGVINYKGYSADFMQALDEIISNIYPMGNGGNNNNSGGSMNPIKKFFG